VFPPALSTLSTLSVHGAAHGAVSSPSTRKYSYYYCSSKMTKMAKTHDDDLRRPLLLLLLLLLLLRLPAATRATFLRTNASFPTGLSYAARLVFLSGANLAWIAGGSTTYVSSFFLLFFAFFPASWTIARFFVFVLLPSSSFSFLLLPATTNQRPTTAGDVICERQHGSLMAASRPVFFPLSLTNDNEERQQHTRHGRRSSFSRSSPLPLSLALPLVSLSLSIYLSLSLSLSSHSMSLEI
jgi:hypothetical protein